MKKPVARLPRALSKRKPNSAFLESVYQTQTQTIPAKCHENKRLSRYDQNSNAGYLRLSERPEQWYSLG